MHEEQEMNQLLHSKPVITLGGGCFWCLEAVYTELQGVVKLVSGYAGGTLANPTYQQVCSGNTGHAEVVQVTFDPEVVTFQEILGVFFSIHDPTTLDRQGADVGTQYRSVIFYESEAQKEAAEQFIAEITAERIFPASIVTELSPLGTFYEAEDYHQDYYQYNSQQPYCRAVITPKVAKFRKAYAKKLK
jgi:peptide-methionine (S)-S-oxide reductase